jgi:hypothetical protein
MRSSVLGADRGADGREGAGPGARAALDTSARGSSDVIGGA